jgi:glycosyltransferase involved in cell wall biosynthesis
LVSALRQEAVAAEVIIVDDGSRRPVDAILSDWALDRVRVIRHPSSMGQMAARNAGIAAARAPWIALLDDDDLWAPNKLRRQLDAAAAAHAEFAFTAGVAIDRYGRVLYSEPAPPAGPNLHRQLLSSRVVPYIASNVIATASLVERIGQFDTALQHLGDWDLVVRLSGAGVAVGVDEPLLAYRLHGANFQIDETGLMDELRHFSEKHADARVANAASIDMAGWWRWRIGARQLAGDRQGTAAANWQLARVTHSPRDATRSIAMLLGGERAMSFARRLRRGQPRAMAPAWLEAALRVPAETLSEVRRSTK